MNEYAWNGYDGDFYKEDADGTKRWYRDGWLHRDDDEPALVCPDGHREWFKNGRLHRDDGPAVITADGQEFWYFNDKLQVWTL